MSWSKEQLAAINTRDKQILVAAAAGSGKTSVLVERIISRVLDEAAPLDLDRLLVVTFTNAAAAEMRGRIGAALTKALAERPQSSHLQRQLVLLNAATISTIHAFCQSIVRQNFHLLELDPKFRVAGEAEVRLLKADVLEAVFEQRYNADDPEFFQFVEHYGDGHDDSGLYQLVLALYEFSRSHPWPEHWLRSLEQAFCLPGAAGLEDTPWPAILREKIALELEQARQSLVMFSREAEQPGQPDAYVDTFEADQKLLDHIIRAARQSWTALRECLIAADFGKLPSVKGVDKAVRDYYQKGRQKAKDAVQQIQGLYFSRQDEEFMADLRRVAPLVTALTGLVTQFGEAYSQAKRQRALVDFNDLEHLCLQVLLADGAAPGEVLPSTAAKALREKFAEIMVDEYQDTNGVQETILRLLVRDEGAGLFLVGDVKQSIYRFRLAEPGLFLEKYRTYPTRGEGYCRIDLSRNFRSRPGVLAAINFLFCQIMAPRVAELEYGEAERLNPGPGYPPADGPVLDGPVEVCLIDRESQPLTDDDSRPEADEADPAGEAATGPDEVSGFELESRLIARQITSYMKGGYQVYDKELQAYRPLAWRDIVILLRSVKGKAAVLQDTLKKADIPVYAEVEGGYFREIEVQVLLSLLSVIDNPRQDIHLAGVLRSPLVGLGAAELARIRLARPGELWEAVTAYAETAGGDDPALQQKLAAFLERLAGWRNLSRRKGVPELIWQIYRDTGYYDYVGGMPGGLLRQANLRALYDRARQYETTNFRGLFRFLRFIERMQDKGTDLAVARALGEGEDVVRIMSIHKSKGLEFPLVFVADLGKQINLQDSRGLLLCHKTLGIGPFVTNPELRYRYPTLARHAIAHQLNMETKAEEMRILYVALTRAREKLVLVGTVNKLAERAKAWCQAAGSAVRQLPDGLLAGAKTYLDWIGPALVRHAAGEKLRDLAGWEGVLAVDWSDYPSDWQLELYPAAVLTDPTATDPAAWPFMQQVRQLAPVPAGDDPAAVARRLEWRYPQATVVGKAAKLSVTEIKRRFDSPEDGGEGQQRLLGLKPAFVRPGFIQTGKKLTAAEAGTLLHLVMQHIDYRGDVSPAGIAAQVEAMVHRQLLLAEQAVAVPSAAIAGFFNGELGLRLRHAARVRRELPFSMVLPAGEFYPELAGQEEGIFVQGVVDMLLDEPDGLVLVDYKTDRGKDREALAAQYKIQLELYARAMTGILKLPVKEKYIYSFYLEDIILMD